MKIFSWCELSTIFRRKIPKQTLFQLKVFFTKKMYLLIKFVHCYYLLKYHYCYYYLLILNKYDRFRKIKKWLNITLNLVLQGNIIIISHCPREFHDIVAGFLIRDNNDTAMDFWKSDQSQSLKYMIVSTFLTK